MKDLKGRPLNERGLAHRLRQFGIKSRTIRIVDTTPKGYLRTDLHDAWSRYLSSPDKSATCATSAANTQIQPVSSIDDVADVAKVADAVGLVRREKLNGHNDVADVADFPRDTLAPQSCAQCNADDNGKLQFYSHAPNAPLGVWLHKECKPFYFGER